MAYPLLRQISGNVFLAACTAAYKLYNELMNKNAILQQIQRPISPAWGGRKI